MGVVPVGLFLADLATGVGDKGLSQVGFRHRWSPCMFRGSAGERRQAAGRRSLGVGWSGAGQARVALETAAEAARRGR